MSFHIAESACSLITSELAKSQFLDYGMDPARLQWNKVAKLLQLQSYLSSGQRSKYTGMLYILKNVYPRVKKTIENWWRSNFRLFHPSRYVVERTGHGRCAGGADWRLCRNWMRKAGRPASGVVLNRAMWIDGNDGQVYSGSIVLV